MPKPPDWEGIGRGMGPQWDSNAILKGPQSRQVAAKSGSKQLYLGL